jgi:hypothetical protein
LRMLFSYFSYRRNDDPEVRECPNGTLLAAGCAGVVRIASGWKCMQESGPSVSPYSQRHSACKREINNPLTPNFLLNGR